MQSKIKLIAIAFTSLVLTACGGGGSSNNQADTRELTQATPTPSSAPNTSSTPNISRGPCAHIPDGQACKIDALAYHTVGSKNTDGEALLAYGHIWKYNANGSLKEPATELSTTLPFGGDIAAPATRPCNLRPVNEACVIDSFAIYHIDVADPKQTSNPFGHFDQISAYGTQWTFDPSFKLMNNAAMSLTSITKYGIDNNSTGPCSFVPQDKKCKFDTHAYFDARKELSDYYEIITAYGRYFKYNFTGVLIENSFLTDIARYGSNAAAANQTPAGPCTYAPENSLCTFEGMDLKRVNGKLIEVVIAYNRYWEFDVATNAVLIAGTPLKSVPRFN